MSRSRSAVWAEHVIDGDLAYEMDARDIPKDWPTGMIPLRKGMPYEQPVRAELEGEIYTLNRVAGGLGVPPDAGRSAGGYRTRSGDPARVSKDFPTRRKPPFVAKGDTIRAARSGTATRMDAWANAWTRYFTEGKGNYMISAMEDTGTMQSLTFLKNAGRVDLNRVLVLRTVSNYDREAPGSTPAESLKGLVGRDLFRVYSGARHGADSGSKVVHYLVEHWAECEKTVPR